MAQTDGAPLPEPAEAGGDPGAATNRLKAAIASHGIAVEYAEELDGALGTSSGGRIQVLAGFQPASEFMVLAHEFAHLCSAVAYVQSGRRGSVPVGPSGGQFPRVVVQTG